MEGDSFAPKFAPDGRALYYLRKAFPGSGATELWRANLRSGYREVLLPGIAIQTNPLPSYDVSTDGRTVVAAGLDKTGKPRLWIVDTDRSSPPRQLTGIEGDLPFFAGNGEVFFHFHESGLESAYIARIGVDGTGLRRVTDQPTTLLKGISPDRQWLLAVRHRGNDAEVVALPIDGGMPIALFLAGAGPVDSPVSWSHEGRRMFITLPSSTGSEPNGLTYVVPLSRGKAFPPIPPGGFTSEEQIHHLPGVRVIDSVDVAPGPAPDTYAFTKQSVRRNLYRIPLP
jgi:hypothetical protein